MLLAVACIAQQQARGIIVCMGQQGGIAARARASACNRREAGQQYSNESGAPLPASHKIEDRINIQFAPACLPATPGESLRCKHMAGNTRKQRLYIANQAFRWQCSPLQQTTHPRQLPVSLKGAKGLQAAGLGAQIS